MQATGVRARTRSRATCQDRSRRAALLLASLFPMVNLGCLPAGASSALAALSGLSGLSAGTTATPNLASAIPIFGSGTLPSLPDGSGQLGKSAGKDIPLPGADSPERPIPVGPGRARRAVLLIPGLAMPGASLAAMQAYLVAQGLSEVHTVDNPGGGISTSIEACAEQVETRMRELAAQGIEAVDLVGHSMGGLVAREVARRAATGLPVPVLVTVATPNLGNGKAAGLLEKLGSPSAIGQMAEGSDFLDRLNAAPLPAGTQAFGLWTRSDDVVRPAGNCRLPGGTDQELEVGSLGAHMAMGFHPTSLATIHRLLASSA